MSKDYSFRGGNLILTRDFENRLNSGDQEAYVKFVQLQADLPNVKIIFKPKAHRTNKTQLNYVTMEKYIKCLQNSEKWLAEFKAIREVSRGHESPYNIVRNWFKQSFPAYKEEPEFDENYRLIVNKPAQPPKLELVKEQSAEAIGA